jgi:hypothetical protein
MFAMRGGNQSDLIRAEKIPGTSTIRVVYEIPETGPVSISVIGPGDKHLHTYPPRVIQTGVPFGIKIPNLPQGNYKLKFIDEQGFEHIEKVLIKN